MAARVLTGVWAQPACADCAASMARRVSAVPQLATLAMTSPVAGFLMSRVVPSSEGVHCQSIYAPDLIRRPSFNLMPMFRFSILAVNGSAQTAPAIYRQLAAARSIAAQLSISYCIFCRSCPQQVNTPPAARTCRGVSISGRQRKIRA